MHRDDALILTGSYIAVDKSVRYDRGTTYVTDHTRFTNAAELAQEDGLLVAICCCRSVG